MSNVFEAVEETVDSGKKKKYRRPFAIWRVGGREIKMKLTTSTQVALEAKYKTSLMNLLADEGGVPTLTLMLDIVKEAAQPYNHDIDKNKIMNLFDKYIEEGGSITEFYTDVYMDVFIASGFFTKAAEKAMKEATAQ